MLWLHVTNSLLLFYLQVQSALTVFSSAFGERRPDISFLILKSFSFNAYNTCKFLLA